MNIPLISLGALIPWIITAIFCSVVDVPITQALSSVGMVFLAILPLIIFVTYLVAFIQGRSIAVLDTAQTTLKFVNGHKHRVIPIITSLWGRKKK